VASFSHFTAAMKTYEYWLHLPTRDLWAVVGMDDAVVVQACGPMDPHYTVSSLLPHLPYTTDDVTWMQRCRAAFEKTTLTP
jgi:hypothetical protein